MPKLSEMLFGKKAKTKQLSTLDPMQQELLKLITQGLQSGDGPLKDLFGQFDKASFDEGVTKPALKQFQDEILPQLQEKFIANGNTQSSGFDRAKLKAGVDLQSRLAELMYGAQQQQKQNRLAGLQTGLGRQTIENLYKPGSEGLVQGALKGVASGLGNAAGMAIAG